MIAKYFEELHYFLKGQSLEDDEGFQKDIYYISPALGGLKEKTA